MGKKSNNRIEAARNAVTGYAAIVLGIACFIIALMSIVVIVRLIVGISGSGSTATATAIATATSLATGGRITA